MKKLLFTIFLAVLFGAVLPRQAQAHVTFSYFYDSLQPYGEWVDVDAYGYCWQPRGLDRDWRPYTDGYWAFTDAGWTWVSYEDFGSITYHYGRWIRLEDYGWVWKPDYQWGPAWVSWRQSEEYIGWAPLPPDAVFEPQIGIGVWVDRDYDIGPSVYSFCEYRSFGAPVMRNVLIPRHRNFAIINHTVNITNITVVGGNGGGMVFNGGLDYARVSARSQNRIEALQLVRQTDGDWAQHHRPELSRRVGSQLIVHAPVVEAPKTQFAPASVSQQIRAPKVDRGWSGISDPAQKEQIKAHYHDESRGLTRTSAPAKPVDAGQVQNMIHQAHTRQTPAPMQVQQQPQIQQIQPPVQSQPTQVQPLPSGKKDRSHQREQRSEPVPQVAPVQPTAPMQVAPVQPPAPIQPVPSGSKEHSRHSEKHPQQQQPVPSPQAALPQEQAQRAQQAQAEQQRRTGEAQARAARDQREQAQRAQQAQAQAEQQRRAGGAAETQARAAGHAQQEMQHRQAVPQHPPAQAAPAQAQPTATPDADEHKRHN